MEQTDETSIPTVNSCCNPRDLFFLTHNYTIAAVDGAATQQAITHSNPQTPALKVFKKIIPTVV